MTPWFSEAPKLEPAVKPRTLPLTLTTLGLNLNGPQQTLQCPRTKYNVFHGNHATDFLLSGSSPAETFDNHGPGPDTLSKSTGVTCFET